MGWLLATTAIWISSNIANVEFAAASLSQVVLRFVTVNIVSCFKQNQSQMRDLLLPCRCSLVGKSSSSEKVVADLGGTGARTLDELIITWLWGCSSTAP